MTMVNKKTVRSLIHRTEVENTGKVPVLESDLPFDVSFFYIFWKVECMFVVELFSFLLAALKLHFFKTDNPS